MAAAFVVAASIMAFSVAPSFVVTIGATLAVAVFVGFPLFAAGDAIVLWAPVIALSDDFDVGDVLIVSESPAPV